VHSLLPHPARRPRPPRRAGGVSSAGRSSYSLSLASSYCCSSAASCSVSFSVLQGGTQVGNVKVTKNVANTSVLRR
jgi:hypothetical protein